MYHTSTHKVSPQVQAKFICQPSGAVMSRWACHHQTTPRCQNCKQYRWVWLKPTHSEEVRDLNGFPLPNPNPSILRAIKSVWSSSATEHDTIMNWAICTLAFFGFFRLGEILLTTANQFDPKRHIAVGDVAVDSRQNPSLVRVHPKCSKTDQLRKGVDIYIGKTRDDICPVAAVLSVHAIRGQKPSPLFVCYDSPPCTKGRFIPKLRSALHAAGLVGPNFAGLSFRIGAATTAAERGIEDSTIKARGDGTAPPFWLT